MKNNVSNLLQIGIFTLFIMGGGFLLAQTDIIKNIGTQTENQEHTQVETQTTTTPVAEVAVETQEIAVTKKAPLADTASKPSTASQSTPEYTTAQAKLEETLRKAEENIKACREGTVVNKGCETLPEVYADLKDCLLSKSAEDMNACHFSTLMVDTASGYETDLEVTSGKTPISFQRMQAKRDLEKLISSGNFQNKIAQAHNEFIVCKDASRADDIDCLEGLYLLEGIDTLCPKTDDKEALGQCVDPVLDYMEKKIKTYNDSISGISYRSNTSENTPTVTREETTVTNTNTQTSNIVISNLSHKTVSVSDIPKLTNEPLTYKVTLNGKSEECSYSTYKYINQSGKSVFSDNTLHHCYGIVNGVYTDSAFFFNNKSSLTLKYFEEQGIDHIIVEFYVKDKNGDESNRLQLKITK